MIGRIPPPAMFAKAWKTSSTSGRNALKNGDLEEELIANEDRLIKKSSFEM